MDSKNSVVKNDATRPKKTPAQKPLDTTPQPTSGPEIWDGNSAGWTLVTSGRRKNKNRK